MNKLGKMMQHIEHCEDYNKCGKCKNFLESFIIKNRHCGDAY